jgi:hypothetical protein
MKDMCAECGADLRKEDLTQQNASVPMVHSIPELKVSKEVKLSTTPQRYIGHREIKLYSFFI